ncbi:MAG: Flp family type IVb pilin [Eubacterium sp.]|nr:Flp family type IVb pilin [Eubacterium sp.]
MRFILDENGQGMIEYALIIGLISVVAIVTLVFFGPKLREIYYRTNEVVTDGN